MNQFEIQKRNAEGYARHYNDLAKSRFKGSAYAAGFLGVTIFCHALVNMNKSPDIYEDALRDMRQGTLVLPGAYIKNQLDNCLADNKTNKNECSEAKLATRLDIQQGYVRSLAPNNTGLGVGLLYAGAFVSLFGAGCFARRKENKQNENASAAKADAAFDRLKL